MKKLFVLTGLVFALSGCKTFKGELNANSDLTFNAKKGTVTVAKGYYNADISFPSKTKVDLKVHNRSTNQTTTVSFNVPKNFDLPGDNGSFHLSSEQVGQPYDLAGDLKTTTWRSPLYSSMEGCTYQVQRRECYNTPQGVQCRWVTYIVHGMRSVQYYDEITDQSLAFDLIATENSEGSAGTFQGEYRDSSRRYTNVGPCY